MKLVMNVRTVDLKKPDAATDFIASLRETGFAVLENHPVSKDLIHAVFKDWEDFFALPESEKQKHLFDANLQAGFFPYRTENAKNSVFKDLKEFYHHYPWHPLPPNTEKNTKTLFQSMMVLGKTLLDYIEESTPENLGFRDRKAFSEMVGDHRECLLRPIHYPAFKGSEENGAIRAAAHEDINLITLLIAATEPGLEVKDLHGNWHPVNCDPDTIVVNAGDMLQLATEKYFVSTTHRVVNPEGNRASKPRFSIPLFVHATKDAQITQSTTAGQFLDERLREIGLKK